MGNEGLNGTAYRMSQIFAFADDQECMAGCCDFGVVIHIHHTRAPRNALSDSPWPRGVAGLSYTERTLRIRPLLTVVTPKTYIARCSPFSAPHPTRGASSSD